MIRSLLILFSFLAASQAVAARFADPAHDLANLSALIGERRALMHDVAAYKWQRKLPIEDRVREEALRKQMAGRAGLLGLDPAPVVQFFDLQMRWARAVQAKAFADFRNSPPNRTRDLNAELRPQLDRIGEQLIRTLYLLAPAIEARTLELDANAMAADGLSRQEAQELVTVLAAIKRTAADPLQRMTASGVLRVGLTGDYAPFSLERDAELSGADVELATTLARALGVEVRFVRTSWSNLMGDFERGQFDLAAGGISITADRKARASFGPVYHVGGKTPIVRCGDEKRFDTVSEINEPAVRVVVNPGGTNERFAREHFTRAQLRVVPDNRAVFAEIEAGRADVMVTDDIEVDLHARRSKRLCRATASTFTTSEKAWMLPQSKAFVESVSTWMRNALQSGEVSDVIERHMH